MVRFYLCLTTSENDYQQEQAATAQKAAHKLGLDLQIADAGGDPIKQSTMLMEAVTSGRFQGVLFEPVGLPMTQAAQKAVEAGLGWVVLNRVPDYLAPLRKAAKAPTFAVSTDHLEVGCIQGRQAAALLPQGGSILVIQGKIGSDAARERTEGFQKTRPAAATVRVLHGAWTEGSGYDAIRSWGRLSHAAVDLVVAQNDVMAVGARKALVELAETAPARARLTRLPVIGADGLPDGGQRWLREGTITATTHIPANAGPAVELLASALHGDASAATVNKTTPHSLPPLDSLRPVRPD